MPTQAEMKKSKPRGLGRGLNALFEDEENFETAAPAQAPKAGPSIETPRIGRLMAGVEQLYRNETQPRTEFDQEALRQLADSLKEHGMLQAITVREIPSEKGRYQIVAGERRWRAAQIAQLHEVPINVVDLNEEETLAVALIENLQREDLNPIEEALGYHRLLNDHKKTQEEIAKVIGKSRSHVANTVRLLNLPASVIEYLRKGALTAGHARALLTSEDPETLAKQIVEKGMNVRAAEALAADAPAKGGARKQGRGKTPKDVDTVALEEDLSNTIGMKVIIDSKDSASGTLKIEFKNLNQLDELIQRIAKAPKAILAE